MARWKARGLLPISANWTFFASYYGWGAISRYWSKLRYLTGEWVTLNENYRGKGESPPTNFGIRKLEFLGYRTVKKKLPKISTGWVGRTNATDRQTTDWIAMASSEREREFTSAKNCYLWCNAVSAKWWTVAILEKNDKPLYRSNDLACRHKVWYDNTHWLQNLISAVKNLNI